MNKIIDKSNAKVLGSIIKMNRILQNMSQKALCEGICVNSYLSRIENAEVMPSEEVLFDIFDALSITFNDSEEFLQESKNKFNQFLEELMFNEFENSHIIFKELENRETTFINSPLIIDYYIVKLAHYCTQNQRGVFSQTKKLLESVVDLMSKEQKFRYYLYTGIDTVKVYHDFALAFYLFDKAKNYGENGHLIYWIAQTYLRMDNRLKALEFFQKALEMYLKEGNLISVIGTFEMIGVTYFDLDEYFDGLEYFDNALRLAKKMGSEYFVNNISNHFAWGYFCLCDYEKAMDILVDHRYAGDHTINSSIIKFAINISLKDKQAMDGLKDEFHYREKKIHKLIYEVISNDKNIDFDRSIISNEMLLKDLYTESSNVNRELSKYFKGMLINYYKINRRYKEALELSETSKKTRAIINEKLKYGFNM